MHSDRLHGLDNLRGLAALMVVIYHAEIVVGGQRLIGHGYLAVDFFFALSGFVMTRTYEGRFQGALAFGAMRLTRFAPVMACGSVLGFFALGPSVGWSNALFLAVLSLLYIPLPSREHPLIPANPPQWSILFELIANLLHAAILARLRVTALIAIMLISAALILVFAEKPDDPALFLPRTLLSYCAGIVLCRTRHRLPNVPYVLAPLLLLGWPLAADVWPLLGWLFVLAGPAVIVLAGLTSSKVWPLAGPLSFPLYAVHYPVLVMAQNNQVSPWLGVVGAIAVALGVTAIFERNALTQSFRNRTTAP